MRYKVAPPARSLAQLETAREAVPFVPDESGDCCRAIQRATDITDREAARELLTFLAALGLVAETERGYHRTRTELEQPSLASAYRERVFLVEELLDAVENGADSPEAAFDAVRAQIPRWERERHPDWASHWQERVEQLLAWAVLFGALTVRDGRLRSQSA